MEKAQTIVYPAIFSPENNTYNVTFPDIAEAITFGEDIPEAVIMAQSALGLALYERTQIPPHQKTFTLKVMRILS